MSVEIGVVLLVYQLMVQSAIGGVNITQTVEGRERYPVNLRYPQAARKDIQTLKELPIVTPSGAHITLNDHTGQGNEANTNRN